MRAQKRRKGIIDSDDDGAGPTAQLQEESEDDEASTTTDEENFIVEDNGDIDEEELARAERLMPSEQIVAHASHKAYRPIDYRLGFVLLAQFSKHGALTLEQHFYIFVGLHVSREYYSVTKNPSKGHFRGIPVFLA